MPGKSFDPGRKRNNAGQAVVLLKGQQGQAVLADKVYDADSIVEARQKMGAELI